MTILNRNRWLAGTFTALLFASLFSSLSTGSVDHSTFSSQQMKASNETGPDSNDLTVDFLILSEPGLEFVISDMKVDSLGNMYILGRVYGQGSFEGHQISLHSSASEPFLVKYNQSGALEWYVPATAENTFWSVQLDRDENPVIAGCARDPANHSSIEFTSSTQNVGVLFHYSKTGLLTKVTGLVTEERQEDRESYISNIASELTGMCFMSDGTMLVVGLLEGAVYVEGTESWLNTTRIQMFMASIDGNSTITRGMVISTGDFWPIEFPSAHCGRNGVGITGIHATGRVVIQDEVISTPSNGSSFTHYLISLSANLTLIGGHELKCSPNFIFNCGLRGGMHFEDDHYWISFAASPLATFNGEDVQNLSWGNPNGPAHYLLRFREGVPSGGMDQPISLEDESFLFVSSLGASPEVSVSLTVCYNGALDFDDIRLNSSDPNYSTAILKADVSEGPNSTHFEFEIVDSIHGPCLVRQASHSSGSYAAGGMLPVEFTHPEYGTSESELRRIGIWFVVLDRDEDGVRDSLDNCIEIPNADQSDHDSDSVGDKCDGDLDGDGVPNDTDTCKQGLISWTSENESDHDRDGCHDGLEDLDDDNDVIPDRIDACPQGEVNWVSGHLADHDTDGCRDFDEDDDDDDDGVADQADNCPRGKKHWNSTKFSDHDHDGCFDNSEDEDDDQDSLLDSSDHCPRGMLAWESSPETDHDGDGCKDLDEDDDDDSDTLLDHLDSCPKGPIGWISNSTTDPNSDGCPDTQIVEDSDGDGVPDLVDYCPLQAGTSSEYPQIGCSDSDGDGWADDRDAFPIYPTQWNDSDGDGFGDNWADPGWNSSRENGTGMWVADAIYPDKCPFTWGAEEGCDTESTGIEAERNPARSEGMDPNWIIILMLLMLGYLLKSHPR